MARPLETSGLSQVSVVTSLEAEEPVAALLERLFGAATSVYSNLEKLHSVITTYSYEPSKVLREKLPALKEGLNELRAVGLNTGQEDILIQKVRREDWSESWKKYFKTILIGRALMIKPSWSRHEPQKGQAVVVLDPGLSFGTGQHATTSFCLKQIVALRGRNRSLLDIGCGSGILAIAAAKLGYNPVDAFDFDPVAVRVAMKNCRTNRVHHKINLKRQDLTRLPLHSRTQYNIICANLIAPLLISERDRILNRLAPSGTIILAGILSTEFDSVRRAYESAGLKLIKSTTEREWQSGSFRRLVK